MQKKYFFPIFRIFFRFIYPLNCIFFFRYWLKLIVRFLCATNMHKTCISEVRKKMKIFALCSCIFRKKAVILQAEMAKW